MSVFVLCAVIAVVVIGVLIVAMALGYAAKRGDRALGYEPPARPRRRTRKRG